jgi:hypothetical protein
MSTLAIDTYKLLSALKGTGKSANFTAEEIANAVNVAQDDAQLLTKSDFVVGIAEFESRMAGFDVRMDKLDVRMDKLDARMDKFDARMDKFESRMDGFDAKLDLFRADIKAEVKSSQLQNLFWLSGIVLASNGMVIALLARLAHVI